MRNMYAVRKTYTILEDGNMVDISVEEAQELIMEEIKEYNPTNMHWYVQEDQREFCKIVKVRFDTER